MAKSRVLFVCLGNACRSPMAEAFARAHGSDVMEAQSAGLAPALALAPLTHAVMLERNIDMGYFYPRELDCVSGELDLIINMSGYELFARKGAAIEEWDVTDPIGESEETFREVRDEIERRVLELIDRLRTGQTAAPEAGVQRHAS